MRLVFSALLSMLILLLVAFELSYLAGTSHEPPESVEFRKLIVKNYSKLDVQEYAASIFPPNRYNTELKKVELILPGAYIATYGSETYGSVTPSYSGCQTLVIIYERFNANRRWLEADWDNQGKICTYYNSRTRQI